MNEAFLKAYQSIVAGSLGAYPRDVLVAAGATETEIADLERLTDTVLRGHLYIDPAQSLPVWRHLKADGTEVPYGWLPSKEVVALEYTATLQDGTARVLSRIEFHDKVEPITRRGFDTLHILGNPARKVLGGVSRKWVQDYIEERFDFVTDPSQYVRSKQASA